MVKILYNVVKKPFSMFPSCAKENKGNSASEICPDCKIPLDEPQYVYEPNINVDLEEDSDSAKRCGKDLAKRIIWKIVEAVTYIMVAFIAAIVLISCINFASDFSNGKPMGLKHIYYICVGFSGSITVLYFISEHDAHEKRLAKLFKTAIPKFAVVVNMPKPQKTPDSPIVLRIRVANRNQDYIETEINREQINCQTLVARCCKELGILPEQIEKLVKYPEVRLRGDEDIKRFRKLESLEVYLRAPKAVTKATKAPAPAKAAE